MKAIPLRGAKAAGRVALIDDEDYELVSGYSWHIEEQQSLNRRTHGPYAVTNIRRGGPYRRIAMHTLITGWPLTDHKDHDGLNNQRSNLRPATTAQNNHNQRPRSGTSSRYKGVTWHKKARKWQAAIKVDGKNRHLGVFTSEEDAARAYAEAALAIQGEYAYAAREASGDAA